MADTDIAKRAQFDLIRYAQAWEDADILVAALRPKAGDTVVSIASAGDNALALLAEGPERVIAVDLNPVQLACVRIRVAMYSVLTHEHFLELMGSRPSGRRRHLLEIHLLLVLTRSLALHHLEHRLLRQQQQR